MGYIGHLTSLKWFIVVLSVFLIAYCEGRLEIVHLNKTFFEAEVYCEVHGGGHLVSINAQTDNDAVHTLCDAAGVDCWIGLTQGDLNFQWTDGSSVYYTNWHSGEPDNWHGVELCAKMLSRYHDGTWSDQSCDEDYAKSYFVCEYPRNHNNQTTPSHQMTVTETSEMMATTTQTNKVQTGIDVSKLTIDSDHAHFRYNNERVFLSGINQAWVAYAYDFGSSQYQYRRQAYEKTIVQVAQSGGNSIRIWIHCEGETSPLFDAQGHVTGTDKDNTLISDLRQYIQFATQHNVLVFPTLWNAAVKQSYHYRLDGLIKDTSKLTSYVNNALIPLVAALKDEPGLGGWDIINEMEGELTPDTVNSDPCFNTLFLHNSGAGWVGHLYTAQEFQRFINYQADAIRRTDPRAQVTAGAWNPASDTDQFGSTNLYKDECLIKAGGKQMGTLTFYSMHSYSWNGKYSDNQPFKHNNTDYGLDKPVVVAEFNQKQGGGMLMTQQFPWLYHHGYAGGWSWSYTDETWDRQSAGMAAIKDLNNQNEGGKVHIILK